MAGLVPVPSPRPLRVWVAKPNGESFGQRESTFLEAEQSTSVGRLRWGWGGGQAGGLCSLNALQPSAHQAGKHGHHHLGLHLHHVLWQGIDAGANPPGHGDGVPGERKEGHLQIWQGPIYKRSACTPAELDLNPEPIELPWG